MLAGEAADDVSVHGCRDMAGNGYEWTRTWLTNPQVLTDKFELTVSQPKIPKDALFLLRGMSYRKARPLTFAFLESGFLPKEPYSREGDSWVPLYEIGFRVIVGPGEVTSP